MAGKETDLLRDPLALAQQRYQEQVQAFKDQYIPKPTRADGIAWAQAHGVRPELLMGRRNRRNRRNG